MTVAIPIKASSSLEFENHNDDIGRERNGLSGEMIRFVLLHFAALEASTLGEYTFERHETDSPNAASGLDIFDGAGKLVFQGKEFPSGMAGYWRPSGEKVWGRGTRASSPAPG